MKLKDAFDDLERFRVQVRVVAPESPAEDHVARDDDTARLVRLAGEFGLALGRGARKELERRASALAREFQPGGPLDVMWCRVLPPLGWEVDEGGLPPPGINGTSLLFPFELAGHRMSVQARLGRLADEQARDEGQSGQGTPDALDDGRAWLETLDALDDYLARQHCWGSLIIHYCAEGRRGVDGARLLPHTRDVLRGQLPAAAMAVRDAARSLVRWSRDRKVRAGRLLNRPAKQLPATRHSQDFRHVFWSGREYHFTPKQAKCVSLLWAAWENGTPELGDDYMAAQAEADARLIDLFKDHGAWGEMIVPGHTKGSHRLREPEYL